MPLDQAIFALLRDMIYEKTGIMYEDRKKAFFESRIAGRFTALGIDNPREYWRHLRYQDADGSEFQLLVETLTVNETYFFREFPQLQAFADIALTKITKAKRAAGDYTLNIWSACCSSGDEPYTLAIILRECLDDFDKWKLRLVATDIDREILRVAAHGVYSFRAVKDVPDAYRQRYFRVHEEQYCLSASIRQMVSFSHLNLMDRAGMRRNCGFDFIFCRNALIYFDVESCRQVLSSFYDALVPGGYIFLGHSESVGRISAAFEMVRLGDTITYRRPLNGAAAGKTKQGGVPCQAR